MGIQAYRSVLAVRDVRRVLWLSMVVRVPLWAANVVLTLHVVTHLHRSYTEAGILGGVETIALAISAPWRGRRLDQVGLRKAIVPSLVILTVCWSIAPFVPYWPLLILVGAAGLWVVPSFSIVRQALIHAVPDEMRKTALSVDSVVIEISFMIGPVLGVLLATTWSTTWTLLVCFLSSVVGGVVLWFTDPALGNEPGSGKGAGLRSWVSPSAIAVLAAVLATTIVLTGTDVSIVAALRHMGHPAYIGAELALWGVGSALGGILYGAMHRTVPAFVLLALLSGLTLPTVFARDPITLAVLLVLAGFACAPTITATVDALSRVVPEHVRGEAMGWHSSALTTGSAAGAPVAGVAIDHLGWQAGLWLPAVIGLAVAAAGLGATRLRHSRAAADRPGRALQNAGS